MTTPTAEAAEATPSAVRSMMRGDNIKDTTSEGGTINEDVTISVASKDTTRVEVDGDIALARDQEDTKEVVINYHNFLRILPLVIMALGVGAMEVAAMIVAGEAHTAVTGPMERAQSLMQLHEIHVAQLHGE
ncbi:hypothetical protein DVH05_019013 [Phytophthora capsici]|nr:hypothetical protein DVH05_019013 [Phytophthora capsici]